MHTIKSVQSPPLAPLSLVEVQLVVRDEAPLVRFLHRLIVSLETYVRLDTSVLVQLQRVQAGTMHVRALRGRRVEDGGRTSALRCQGRFRAAGVEGSLLCGNKDREGGGGATYIVVRHLSESQLFNSNTSLM